MTELQGTNRSIWIEGSAHSSTIVSGDHNVIIQVFQQSVEQSIEALADRENIAAIGANPYMGLAAFKETDADRYFGREAQIKKLWERFRDLYEQSETPRVLPILGPSGCGKSSLVRAGLLPELVQRPLPVRSSMRVAAMTPGAYPLESLARVLAEINPTDPLLSGFEEELKQVSHESNEYEGLRRIANRIRDIRDTPLIILIDQFEEVYSLCKQPEQQRAFTQNLLHAASDPTGNVSVIFTLRTDFVGETQRYDQLNQIICAEGVLIPGMTKDELRRAIAAPARLAGHTFDDATVDLLVNDTEGREGALPLLQFALTQIWEGLRAGQAPIVTYRDIGGVGGALAGEAQKIYDKLTEPEKQTARRIFIGLVQLGEGSRDTRRRAIIKNLVASQDTVESVRRVIQRFSSPGTRLISLSSQDGKETAEITHEALIEHWGLLNDWLSTSREDIRFQRRLEIDATYWDKQGRPAGSLWRSPELDLLRQFEQKARDDMGPISVAFFHASDRAEKRATRLKFLGIFGLIAGLFFTTGLSGFAGFKAYQAERRRVRLYEATARELADIDELESLVYGLAGIGLGRSTFVKLPNFIREGLLTTALLAEPNENKRFRFVAGHRDTVQAVAFSPDGQTIASGSNNGAIQLWDLQGNLIQSPFKGHVGWIYSLAFSPDGQTIVSSGLDGAVRLWNLQGELIRTVNISDTSSVSIILSVAFSPDGQTIIGGSGGRSEDSVIRLWDLQGNLVGDPFEGHDDAVSSVAASPNGKIIVSGGLDNTVRLWDFQGNPIGGPFEGHGGIVHSVAFNPDGQTIVSGSEDGTVRLWDLQGNPIGNPFEEHSGEVTSVAFSPDGQTIVSSSKDGTVRLWDLQGNSIGDPFEGHRGEVYSVAFGPDGQTIVSGGLDETIRLWELQNESISSSFKGHNDVVHSVAFSPDGQTIVSGSNDRTIQLSGLQGNPLSVPFRGHNGAVYSVAFSPDGQTIVSGSEDGTLRLWDLKGNSIGSPIEGHSGDTSSLTFSPHVREIISSNTVYSAAFSPDGRTIVSGSADDTLRLWDLQGNPISVPFEGHRGDVYSVAFSPDRQTIVSGSEDSTIKLWDLQGNPIGVPFEGHSGDVYSVAFSPDGKIIASGSDDNTIRLWDLQGNPIGSAFKGHSGDVYSVAFSPDGRIIASGSDDNTIRLWDLQGNPIGVPLEGHGGDVYSVAFSSDIQTIISSSSDGTVRLWPIELAQDGWISHTCDVLWSYLLTQSKTDEVIREALRTCKRYAWE